jgi:DNA-binding transcriptional MerR regulator
MLSKKYYSISEVADILGVKAHNLRYLDDLLGKKLTRIRGRRYYQLKDIEILKKTLGAEIQHQPKAVTQSEDRLSDMIVRLKKLKKQLAAV